LDARKYDAIGYYRQESINLSDTRCRKISNYRILDAGKYETIGHCMQKVSYYRDYTIDVGCRKLSDNQMLDAGKYQPIGYWMQERIRLSDTGCRKYLTIGFRMQKIGF
jgi:hypothetical protein